MNGCPGTCPREEISQDEVSPGVIADDETIARGAYDPSHGSQKTGKIRPALIPRPHLFAGEGSVWRLGDQGLALGELVERLQAAKNDPLFAVLAPPAKEIRGIRLGADGARAFSLVDECECDADGNKHPAHGHIALCQVQKEEGLEMDSPEFIDAHRALIETFKRHPVWRQSA